MGSINYYFDLNRSATSFTLNADYHIDPIYGYGSTNYAFTYYDDGGDVIASSSGSAGQTASVANSFAFDTGPGVAETTLVFEAENDHDGYGFYFYWNVFDGARETTALQIDGTNDTDIIFGGSANDVLRGFGDDDWLDGGGGADRMYGGRGDDTYIVNNSGDRVFESANSGNDTIRSSVSYTLSANVETLDLTGTGNTSAVGNALDNTIAGNSGDNRIVGAAGADRLYGEGGADTFQYRALGDSTVSSSGRDFIVDFSKTQGDHIDLHLIDANNAAGGNQAFTFIGNQGFHDTAGELRAVYSGANTLVTGDVNGDGRADFAIALKGHIPLNAGDFIL